MAQPLNKKEMALSEPSTDELLRLFNHIPAVVGHWNLECRCVRSNSAYAEYFGKSPAQMANIHIRDLLGPSLYEKTLPHIEAVLAGHPQNFERELRVTNGSTKHTLTTYTPDIVDGKVLGFFAFITDISYLKTLENQRREIERKVVFASRLSALGEMAGGIAHEINTPLAVLNLLTGQMERHLGSPEDRKTELLKAVKTMETTVFKIAEIIKGLRTFAHEGTNDPFQDVRIRDLMKSTLLLCSEKFRVHGIHLHVSEVSPDLSCRCRPVEIRQALYNLLINAYEATSKLEDKWVWLEVTDDSDNIYWTVTDSGKGIESELRDAIMLPFFTTKALGAGPGLGLAVSQSIIEDHHGRLYLDASCENTRFKIQIPKHMDKLSA
jgi:PAS domain S-box-containing protein